MSRSLRQFEPPAQLVFYFQAAAHGAERGVLAKGRIHASEQAAKSLLRAARDAEGVGSVRTTGDDALRAGAAHDVNEIRVADSSP